MDVAKSARSEAKTPQAASYICAASQQPPPSYVGLMLHACAGNAVLRDCQMGLVAGKVLGPIFGPALEI